MEFADRPTEQQVRRRSVSLVVFLLTLISGEPAIAADLLFSPASITTEPVWGLTFFAGASAGQSRLVDILFTPWEGDYGHGAFGGLAISRRIARFHKHFTVEGEAGFGGRAGDNAGVEAWGAVYLRYDGFPWNNRIRTSVGISTGLDYLSNPEVDQYVLHYLGPEIAFALPKYPNKELVFRYHHRSGLFGTFGDELQGSNIVSIGLRLRF